MGVKRVLVTGGAGFIGSHIVDSLIKDNHIVSVIDDLSGGYLRNVNSKAIFFKCDLRDQIKSKKIIDKIKPEIVYHLAANAAENKAQFSPIDITSRNYDTFLNVLVPSINNDMKRIVVTSSIAVYGSIKPPFKETDKPEPEDLYGLSKLSMEESLKILSKVHEFEYVIVRPHNVYGPRQNMADPYRNVVTIMMNAILSGKPYYIYGDGEQRRCFSYIDDVSKAIYKCGFEDVSGRIFNIGSDKDYSINELSNAIQKTTGTKINPIYLNDRPQEVKIAVSDHSLSKKYLDYKDTMSLAHGIEKTWMYASKLGPQKPKLGNIEIYSSKMPDNWKTKRKIKPLVSIMISNHDGLKLGLLDESLKEVLKTTYKNVEIIFIDNKSNDKSVIHVKEKYRDAKIKVIINSENNYTKGLNLGIKATNGEYIVVMHNDVVLGKEFINKVVDYFERNLNVGMVQGKVLLFHDHNIIDSCGETIDSLGAPMTINAGKYSHELNNVEKEILSPASSCFVIRKSVLSVVEKFDELLNIGYEVMDYSMRMWTAGHKVMFLPQAEVFHKHGSTNLNPIYREAVFLNFYKNRLIVMLKNFSYGHLLINLPIAISMYLMLGVIEMLIKGRRQLGLSRLFSIYIVFINFGRIISERLNRKIKISKSSFIKQKSLMYEGDFMKRIGIFLSS